MTENIADRVQGFRRTTQHITRLYGEWFEPKDRSGIEKAMVDWAQRPMELHLYVLAHLAYTNLIQLEALIEKTDQLLLTGLDESQQTRIDMVDALNGLKALLEQGMNEPVLDAARLQLPTLSNEERPLFPDRAGSAAIESDASTQLDAFLKGLSLPVSNDDNTDSPDADPSAQTETAHGGEDVDALIDALGETMGELLDSNGADDGPESSIEAAEAESSDGAADASEAGFNTSHSGDTP